MRLFEYLLKRFIDYKTKYPLEYEMLDCNIKYKLLEKEHTGYFETTNSLKLFVELQNLRLGTSPVINIMQGCQKSSFQVSCVGVDNIPIFSRLWGGWIQRDCIDLFCSMFQYKHNGNYKRLIPQEAIDADSIFDIRLKERQIV